MNNLIEKYILLLEKVYFERGGQQQWIEFIKVKQGINNENRKKLQGLYPKVPQSLLKLFEFSDGSNYRHLEGMKQNIHEESFWRVLGSDLEGLPYYLVSSLQIVEAPNFIKDCFDYLEKEDYDIFDEKIDNTFNWLYFADDFINNGGISQLFIDFSPSSEGKVGQIIRYSHDPDELVVIANSFEEYLQRIIDNKFDFIHKSMF